MLAQQHYRTFAARFDSYPIHVEVLSRFVGRKEQTEIVSALKDGSCDVVSEHNRISGSGAGNHDVRSGNCG